MVFVLKQIAKNKFVIEERIETFIHYFFQIIYYVMIEEKSAYILMVVLNLPF